MGFLNQGMLAMSKGGQGRIRTEIDHYLIPGPRRDLSARPDLDSRVSVFGRHTIAFSQGVEQFL